jgi:hypothetical protein
MTRRTCCVPRSSSIFARCTGDASFAEELRRWLQPCGGGDPQFLHQMARTPCSTGLLWVMRGTSSSKAAASTRTPWTQDERRRAFRRRRSHLPLAAGLGDTNTLERLHGAADAVGSPRRTWKPGRGPSAFIQSLRLRHRIRKASRWGDRQPYRPRCAQRAGPTRAEGVLPPGTEAPDQAGPGLPSLWPRMRVLQVLPKRRPTLSAEARAAVREWQHLPNPSRDALLDETRWVVIDLETSDYILPGQPDFGAVAVRGTHLMFRRLRGHTAAGRTSSAETFCSTASAARRG